MEGSRKDDSGTVHGGRTNRTAAGARGVRPGVPREGSRGVSRRQGRARETGLTRQILDALNGLPGTYARKIHGSVFQSGFPDIVACHHGRSVWIEVKRPGQTPTALQAAELARWATAGAISGVATCVAEALALLDA